VALDEPRSESEPGPLVMPNPVGVASGPSAMARSTMSSSKWIAWEPCTRRRSLPRRGRGTMRRAIVETPAGMLIDRAGPIPDSRPFIRNKLSGPARPPLPRHRERRGLTEDDYLKVTTASRRRRDTVAARESRAMKSNVILPQCQAWRAAFGTDPARSSTRSSVSSAL